MYKISLSLENPVTGDTETMKFQFDPTSLTQVKWDSAFPAVQARLAALMTRSTTAEPQTW